MVKRNRLWGCSRNKKARAEARALNSQKSNYLFSTGPTNKNQQTQTPEQRKPKAGRFRDQGCLKFRREIHCDGISHKSPSTAYVAGCSPLPVIPVVVSDGGRAVNIESCSVGTKESGELNRPGYLVAGE